MENYEENVTFEDILNQSFKKIKVGSTITGTIININNNGEIFVDIGYKADGIIPKKEYSNDANANPMENFKPGDKIKANIIKLNDGQGNVLMSYKKAMLKDVKTEFEQKVNNNEIFEEIVDKVTDKGLIINYKGLIRVFIPLSLSDIGREENPNDIKDQKVRFKIIENTNRKVIGSIKDVVETEKKEKADKFWNEIEVDKKYKGIVTSLSDYGAFVDIGGFQGLLHISEITWGRNENPRDILEVGQEIDVRIKEVDKENRRFKLSYEKKGPNPWKKVEEKYKVGDVVKVKISKLMPFGAFAEIEKGVEGLIHISQICERKISKPEEELRVGQKVNAKIIDVDTEHQKIELSVRELEGTTQEYKED